MKKILFSLVALLLLVSCTTNVSDTQESEEISNPTTMQEMKDDFLGTQTILALGDSLTAGYGVEISKSYPSKLESKIQENGYDYKIINAGVSGDTSRNLLDRAESYKNQEPDIVLVVIGGNDGLRAQSIDTLKTNIQDIIDVYEGDAKIVLGGMEILPIHGLSYARDFKQVYFDISDGNPDIYFLESFLKDVGGVASLNQSDRIHPTGEGYDIITENIYEFLEEENIITK